jgi:4-hydroxy-tetrahydrodipicolinate synthase
MIGGVFAAAATPFTAAKAVDHGRLAAHCRALLARGCDGLAVLGSTGEANSLATWQRQDLLEELIKAGIAPGCLLPGTGTCAIAESAALTRHGLDLGITNFLMLPPFYYKGVSDDGLFDAFAEVIETVADPRLRVVLYHFPALSGVPISLDLIARLRDRFGDVVAGVKDSSGDLANSLAMVRAFPGFAVMAGADPLLLPLLQNGGAGCITALANVISADLALVFANHAKPGRQAEVVATQDRIQRYRQAATSGVQLVNIKVVLAEQYGDESWLRVRPPFVAASPDEAARVQAVFRDIAKTGIAADHSATM